MSMKKIATVTVGSGGAASIDFTSISGAFTHLLLTHSLRTSQATVSTSISMTFNSSSSGFSMRGLYGNGSTATSFSATTYAGESTGANATASTFSNNALIIPNYAGATHKTYSLDSVTESNTGTVIQMLVGGVWANTSAINAISLIPSSGTFVQYSTATLYGITKGSLAGVTVS